MKCKTNNRLCSNLDCEYCYKKSFASHPKSKFLNKEIEVDPRFIHKGSKDKYKFDCSCGHSFVQSIGPIFKNKMWCPYCTNKKIKLCKKEECSHCFKNSFANHEKAKYWHGDNLVKPYEVKPNDVNKFKFLCDCMHTFEISLNDVTRLKGSSWCPYCSKTCKKLCDDDNCDHCFNNSVASHEKADYWSSKNEKKARNVIKCSNILVWFDCNICGHDFEILLSSVTSNRGKKERRWCPYCSKTNKKLCDEECDFCFKNSFASHPKSEYWSKKNDVQPRNVTISSGIKYIFDCPCGHEIYQSPAKISAKKPRWCQYCCKPQQKLCDDNNCNHCLEASFASHPKSEFWSDKNELGPRQVMKACDKVIFFNCENGHEFEAKLSTMVCKDQWCPKCVNKTEEILYKFIKDIYPSVQQQFKRKWCKKGNRYLPFDFCIKNLDIIIELDGDQHFEQVSNWERPESIQERDRYKMDKANENGFTVIRLLQLDVYYNKNEWKNKLIEAINTTYSTPSRVFIEEGNKYNCYKS